ncbi:UNVERIFIED_CONTAM: Senescence-associated protein DIN1 [Sesamum calycinum]|uniref:Senescence-associated protein DIN1 n=1 Tax=Sesamum calycinum TaxID=2727403 RepID=A0AAW2SZG8_9LAMI
MGMEMEMDKTKHMSIRGTAVVPLSSPTAIKSELWGSRPRTSTLITTRIPNLRGMSIESGNEQSTASVPTPTSVPVRVAYELLQAGHRFLDVRTTEEFSDGHVGCKIGKRSLMASSQLLSAGFTGITDMAGGFDAWVENGLPPPTPSDDMHYKENFKN